MNKFELYHNFDFSELNEQFYNFNRNSLLKNKSLIHRLSSNVINYEIIKSDTDFLVVAIRYLTKISYGLFTYITNEKAPNISFDYEGTISYCNLTDNKIVIGLNLILNNTLPYQVRIDSTLGIIFHEFFHKKFTIQDIAKILDLKIEEYYLKHGIKKALFFEKNLLSKLKNTVVNILEDRRIEQLGIECFPGYGFFFDILRKVAFYFQKDRIVNKQNVNNYILDFLVIKILLPELEESTLKKIDFKLSEDYTNISPIFLVPKEDINKIKTKNTILKLKNYIEEIDFNTVITFTQILTHADNIIKLLPPELIDKFEEEFYINTTTPQKNITDFYSNTKSHKIEITHEMISDLEKIKEETIKTSIEVPENNERKLNVSKITKQSDIFKKYTSINIIEEPIKDHIKTKILSNAHTLSGDLCKTLGYLEAKFNRTNNIFELNEGEIDEDELYSISYNENIFFVNEKTPGYSLTLGILVDESNSMKDKILNVLLATLTLTISVKDNPHINLFVYGHSSKLESHKDLDNTYTESIELYKYFNTIEKFTDINRLFNITNRANNIDGFAIQKIGEIMDIVKTRRKVLIIISDGAPNGYYYSGSHAVKHTRESIVDLQNKGYYIIQVCMANIEESASMFDNYIEFKDETSFIYNMKTILLKELTQFFEEI